MRSNRLLSPAKLTILAVALFVTNGWAATQKVLYSFDGRDGANPNGLTFDAQGNLYGTTFYGGTGACFDGAGHGCGTVFELIPQADGTWSQKVLYNFKDDGKDGNWPADGVILDGSGNLYGTTLGGGKPGCGFGGICGTAFELTPTSSGEWKETVLHLFSRKNYDGQSPRTGLLFDSSGNLYGTTYYGGNGSCADGDGIGCGTVYELSPKPNGKWAEKILYRFREKGDGYGPLGGLIFGASGNLYGTTSGGDTVFELARSNNGQWKLTVLHRFRGKKDGSGPGRLTFDASGNLYGTTYYGPPQGYEGGRCPDGTDLGCGVVFELTPTSGGGWKESILHYFNSKGKDGNHPDASVLFDSSDNLYSSTRWGGYWDAGTVFELTPQADGKWEENLLYIFRYGDMAIDSPGTVIFDAAGNLYGVAFYGGRGNCDNEAGGCGGVFEITP